MSNTELNRIISRAAFIVDGYAFSKKENNVEIVALDTPNHVLIMSLNGGIIESSMDDIELTVVQDFWQKNKKYITDPQYA